jgi:hypothetical protein
MEETRKEFQVRVETPCDINEHLETLRQYASECESVLELGVRKCVSSWAFALGLLENGSSNKTLIMNDITVCPTEHIETLANKTDLRIIPIWKNNLTLELEGPVDLTFIDTWHVYGQLKRELERFSPLTKRYIIMHDTTVDAEKGETLRNIHKHNPEQQSKESGIPVEEILKGLWPAIAEFLEAHPEWVLHKRWSHNNGLTILKRVD